MAANGNLGFLRKYISIADAISVFLGKLMAVNIIVLVFLIVYEVVRRYFFSSPTIWGTELQTFMYGTMCLFCIPYATFMQLHARVDIVLRKFSFKTQVFLEILYILLFTFPFMAVLVYCETQVAWHSWTIREYSTLGAWQPPLYYMRAVIPLGAFFIILQGISELFKLILKNANGADDGGMA